MEPVTTIFLMKMLEAALGGFIFAAAFVIMLLHFDQIIDWFRARTYLKTRNPTNLAFSLQEQTRDGNYSTIYGIYNHKINKVYDAETVTSNNIDDELARLHNNNKLVLYE